MLRAKNLRHRTREATATALRQATFNGEPGIRTQSPTGIEGVRLWAQEIEFKQLRSRRASVGVAEVTDSIPVITAC